MDTTTRLLAVLMGAPGIWLMVFPLAAGVPPVDRLNGLLAGGVVAISAGFDYPRAERGGGPSKRVSGISVLLGIWLLFVPFVIDLEGAPIWNDVVIGVLLAAFGGYAVYVASLVERPTSQHSTDEIRVQYPHRQNVRHPDTAGQMCSSP